MTSDALRYPIGKFEVSDTVTLTQRSDAVVAIAELPERLRASVQGLTDVQLDTVYRNGSWTLRQVVHHVADSHMNAYIRFKLALTESTPTIKPYMEERWAELLDARSMPVAISLTLLDALHQRWVTLLRGMVDTDFPRAYYHPENDLIISLTAATMLYAWHGKHHTAVILKFREKQGWTT
jgi:hypothetical protein